MTTKERNVMELRINRMRGIAPGMTAEEAARKLKCTLRSVDSKILRLLIEKVYGK